MTEVHVCDACEIAAKNPRTGRSNQGCRECAAREAAGSMAMTVALARGKINEQLGWILQPSWGDEWKTKGVKAAIAWRKKQKEASRA
jgi:hypothetical protein